jgi:hypothetical protein
MSEAFHDNTFASSFFTSCNLKCTSKISGIPPRIKKNIFSGTFLSILFDGKILSRNTVKAP